MRFVSFFSVLFILLFAGFLIADPVELAYDNGNGRFRFQDLTEDNLEGVCFTPLHPCSLLSVKIMVDQTGEFELHVWGDNGAHEPDQDNDLIEPFTIDIEEQNEWVEIDMTEFGLVFDPPEDFQVGHVCREGGPVLLIDDSDEDFEQRSHLWTYNNGLRRELWHTINGNYMVRAVVEYFDEREQFIFRDVSEEAGIGGIGRSAWGDFDNDGWEDFLVNGRTLYRNNGDGTFDNVSEQAGITDGNPSHGGTWGDFDNDGWLDFIAFTSNSERQEIIFRNNGDGTFYNANEEFFFEHGNNPTGACGWGDANGDGFLDLYIANSEYWNDGNPQYFRDHFYIYSDEFTLFLDYTPQEIARRTYYGRSVAWCDFDMDDDLDFYLSNYRLHPNFLFVNEGGENHEFNDEAAERGVRGYLNQGAYGHTIGSSWADFDNDGDFDLIVGNFAHPWGLPWQDIVMLCRNSGAPDYTFEDIQAESGIKYCETVFCPAWGDYDNDGWLDVFISSVYDGRQPFMYRSAQDGETFENVNYETGFHANCYNSNGVTWCDWDHDGDLDLAIGNGGFYENTGSEGDWVEFVLHGTSQTVNRFAFGSQAFVYVDDRQYLRQVEGGAGAEGSQNSMTLHYGLGEAGKVDSLIVKWMGGETDRYYDIPVNMRWDVYEGEELIVSPTRPGEVLAPGSFELSSLYPNPFNDHLNVEFTIKTTNRLKIDVYDSHGRKVDSLTDKNYEAGTHNLTWTAFSMPAGSYALQAVHSGGVVSRKVVLLK